MLIAFAAHPKYKPVPHLMGRDEFQQISVDMFLRGVGGEVGLDVVEVQISEIGKGI